MPHSITGKHRSKRPDSRPNAKKRKKDRDAAYAAAEAKDVISTRIPKREQKERPVTGKLRQELSHPQLDEEVKRVRYLQKLLRQIETLKMRKEKGEKLNDAQMKKLGRMDEVVAEIEELLDVNLGSSSEDEEDDEEGEDEINKGSDQNEEAEKQVSKMKKR